VSRILTWSWDHTARVWPFNADLDFPAEHVELWIQAVAGSEYDFVTRPNSGSTCRTSRFVKNPCEVSTRLAKESCRLAFVRTQDAL
jgi:hypothetical protein